jgi:hypothetical protein
MIGQPDETRGDELAMRSAGLLAHVHAELDTLDEMLARLPAWRPGRALQAESAWVRGKVDEMSASWGQKLVVAIVGPSGAGKSTLLNALAGRALSPVGLTRPTTREVILYAESEADADGLVGALGHDRVRVETARGEALKHLVLLDTPDTNTTPENRKALAQVLEHVDLMLAVFPAQNPHMADNIAFLRPFVQRLPPDAVVPVLNMVDRVPRRELVDEIVPEFHRTVAREWGVNGRVYMISAGLATAGPRAGALARAEDEAPLHDLNEYDALRALVFDTLDQAGQVVDRRLARAEHLLAMLRAHACQALRDSAGWREQATAALEALRDRAREALTRTMLSQGGAGGLDVHVAFYSVSGSRWWGPVGWLIVLWSLLLRAGAFIAHLGRPRGGILSDSAMLPTPDRVRRSWGDAVTRLYAEAWPPIADALVRAGYDRAAVTDDGDVGEISRPLDALEDARARAYDAHLRRLAEHLSSWPVQLLLNLPVFGMVVWIAFETVGGFFRRQYLPSDYFTHAAIATLAVWLICFVIWQALAAAALGRGLHRAVAREMAVPAAEMMIQPRYGEMAVLRTLQDVCCLEDDGV